VTKATMLVPVNGSETAGEWNQSIRPASNINNEPGGGKKGAGGNLARFGGGEGDYSVTK